MKPLSRKQLNRIVESVVGNYDIDTLMDMDSHGECLGTGDSRDVWEFKPDPTLVIKIENDRSDDDENFEFGYQNESEWNLWQRAKSSPGAEWLAPCIWFGRKEVNDGHVLLQKRTEPLKKLPEIVPNFIQFIDCHESNWGSLDGRPVLHDYGTSNPFQPPDFNDMKMILLDDIQQLYN